MMAQKSRWRAYQNFVIAIRCEGEGRYHVEAKGPTGEATTTFTMPFDEKDVKIFRLEVRHRRRIITRGRVPEPVKPTIEFGSRLFDAVINGNVRDVFVSARHEAGRSDFGLRLQLRLSDAPDLTDLPWEFLYDGHDFLALSDTTPVVRYLNLERPPRAMEVTPPLRLLMSTSAPNDQPQLDVEAERFRVEKALTPLTASGILQIDFAPDATLVTLRSLLRRAKSEGRPYHIWHYVGHGAFDVSQDTSVLVFCDEDTMSYPINGFQLGTLFNSYPEMRLVMLNACEGARTDPLDPFAGVAAALVERGMPAVIGMQDEISDEAASVLAEEFYQALADGLPVDAALTEARRAVFFLPNWVEWATPILFMRSSDGQIFDVTATAQPAAVGQRISEASIPVRCPSFQAGSSIHTQVEDGPDLLAITSPIHLEVVRVPEGEFLMGSELIDKKGTQHRVCLPAFYIGKYPVTNAQYAVFVEATRRKPPSRLKPGEENHPVVKVTWRDTLAFCHWLSQQTGLLFRLPTEAEWEKAARGMDGRFYPWGDDWVEGNCNTREAGIKGTSVVRLFSPLGDSPYGATDMLGNVWEWCQSLYRSYPYQSDDGREDLQADGDRVLRGGSWLSSWTEANCTYRSYSRQDGHFDDVGFRVVLSPYVLTPEP